MSKQSSKIPKSTRFEDALGELETIVKSLETGDQPLDDSLKQFERGIALARFCQQNLSDAEQKVKVLLTEDGSENLSEFETDSD